MTRFALAIHGGCGVMARLDLSEAEWIAARADLGRALLAGHTILASGGSALDAVQAAVVVMENSPHFNAGHGAALNTDGIHELDAAIMDGATRSAGAICAARGVRSPILAARAVLEKGDAVLLAGPAADRFAASQGLEIAPQAWFTTERRQSALSAMKAHAAAGTTATEAEKHGTVGAVARDMAGNLAAATSTGGYTNKPDGRVGDSPIIGAGTYARNGLCAVSGTGKGEFFIRHVVAHEIASRIAYCGETLTQAASKVVMQDLAPYDIGAGLVAVGADGEIAAPFNTDGMFRGWVADNGRFYVASHAEVFEHPTG